MIENASEIKTHYRTCNICEAMCGIEVKYQGKDILSIKPDQEDPFSRGHICPKAVALQDYYHDEERLKKPLRKTADGGWEEISWQAAYDEIGARIRGIQQQHGNDSVGLYFGNPNAHNLGNTLFTRHFVKAVGSRSRFSATSLDQLPHHFAAEHMLGARMAIAVPDINRTDYLLVIGANPVVSNGSMMTAAGMPNRIKDIQKRGGKVVVIDPRRTETAKIANEHHFIRPEKDALLLMAMIHAIIADDLVDLGHLEDRIEGFEQLVGVIDTFSPEAVADTVGIAATTITQLARDFATAPSAVCYSRMGASTQSFGGLCQWLTVVLNIITANFDSEGGAMFPQPAFDPLRNIKPGKPKPHGIHTSRVHKLPLVSGEIPASTLADEILTPGEGQIKAMFTVAGNPVLSAPNGARLDQAFAQLDFMVSVDIYLNETTKHADIILPATHGLEVEHYDVVFNSFAVSNTAKYSPPLFEKEAYQRHDWEILKGLATALTGIADDGSTPLFILDMALKSGQYQEQGLTLKTLMDNPHGIDLGPLKPCIQERIRTDDGNIQLAPDVFLQDLPRLQTTMADDAQIKAQFPFDMISRRLARNHNTWTHNSHRLIKGKNPVTLQLHSDDAARLNINAGQTVTVRSATGQVQMAVDINDDILPGVVSIPQGWGHNHSNTAMSVAAQQPGISINSLTDDTRIDQLTGNAAFNGTPVAIEVCKDVA